MPRLLKKRRYWEITWHRPMWGRVNGRDGVTKRVMGPIPAWMKGRGLVGEKMTVP